MPKNKFQDAIFTLIMATVMVYGMIVYNVALATGGVKGETFFIALHEIASAASDAENFVLEPISRALSRSLSRSSPVVPDTAATFDIAESKSDAVFTAAVPAAIMGTVT